MIRASCGMTSGLPGVGMQEVSLGMFGHAAREIRRQIGQGYVVQTRDQQGAGGGVGLGQGVVDRRLDQAAVGLDGRSGRKQIRAAKGCVHLAQGDLIDISGIDAVASSVPDNAFVFIGSSAFSAAGQVRFFASSGMTYVSLNTNSDLNNVELMIALTGQLTMQQSHFLL